MNDGCKLNKLLDMIKDMKTKQLMKTSEVVMHMIMLNEKLLFLGIMIHTAGFNDLTGAILTQYFKYTRMTYFDYIKSFSQINET